MRHALLLTTLVLIGWPGGAAAQIHIEGTVIDDQSLEPIAAAEVRVFNVRRPHRVLGPLHTNAEGHFSITVPENGGYVFEAERLGYRDTETPTLWTDGYDIYEIEIRLDPDAVLLAPIEVLVRAEGESPVLADFRHRANSGMGHYFTHLDIQRIKPDRVSDLLVRVPGVSLRSSGSGLRRVVYMARGGCPAEIFVDGMHWSRGQDGANLFTVDDAVPSGSILGVEIYRGLSTVPAQFLTPQSRCGVVAIWTRR